MNNVVIVAAVRTPPARRGPARGGAAAQSGSSQQAFTLALGLVRAGLNDTVLACGVESMSRLPSGSRSCTASTGARPTTGPARSWSCPSGGPIAMGHPLGATGCLLVTKAAHELDRLGRGRALVTMCCGGGLGTATLLEAV